MKAPRSLLKPLALCAAAIGAFTIGLAIRTSANSGGELAEVVAPTERRPAPATRASSSSETTPPADRLIAKVQFDPFAPLGTGTPAALGVPKVVAPAAKPAKPASSPPVAPAVATAPPLPFVAVGSINGADVTGGEPLAFLQQQDRLLVVRSGQSIGANYRIESITPQRVEITYLPLMQRQSLPLSP